MIDTGFAERLYASLLHLAAREGKEVSDTEVGRRVGKRLGRGALGYGAVYKWKRGTVPGVSTVLAIAAVCGVDPGWLGFGEDSRAPAPATWTIVLTSRDEAARERAVRDHHRAGRVRAALPPKPPRRQVEQG